jgi:hypothetical protein
MKLLTAEFFRQFSRVKKAYHPYIAQKRPARISESSRSIFFENEVANPREKITTNRCENHEAILMGEQKIREQNERERTSENMEPTAN